MEKINIVKMIDYCFQHDYQLHGAYDDSNSVRHLSGDFKITCVGRLESINRVSYYKTDNLETIFFPCDYSVIDEAEFILSKLRPKVIHMHGNHGWSSYPIYASIFKNDPNVLKMIFSPAGSSCGTPSFLENFDKIIVNSDLQINRMKTNDLDKIVVRRRSADPTVFYLKYADCEKIYDFVYVAGFVPTKQIPVMIDLVSKTKYSLVILGDFLRNQEHYNYVRKYIYDRNLQNQIFLREFIPQDKLSDFFAKCKVFVWPNIKPENPTTTTNRSVIECLACGMPLLLGRRAFSETEFIMHGENGFLYDNEEDFSVKAKEIFQDLSSFRNSSISLNYSKFNFVENFINFYNLLYSDL